MCIEYNHGIDTTNTTKSNMYKPGTVMNIIPCIIRHCNEYYTMYNQVQYYNIKQVL